MEIIRPIHLGSDKTVAQVLEIPEVATELGQWLAERPVTPGADESAWAQNRRAELKDR